MELDKSTGIVLKTFPQRNKIMVLDRGLGIIEVFSDLSSKVKRLCNGVFIVYVVQQARGRYHLSALDFLHVPFSWARADILFLHHVLELASYFIPPQSPHEDVFNLIRDLYATKARSSLLFKKQFLIHFFILLGIYPEDEKFLNKMLLFVKKPIDVIGQDCLHLDAKQIDAWLESCIRMHPYNEYFKTSHFLTTATGTDEKS